MFFSAGVGGVPEGGGRGGWGLLGGVLGLGLLFDFLSVCVGGVGWVGVDDDGVFLLGFVGCLECGSVSSE